MRFEDQDCERRKKRLTMNSNQIFLITGGGRGLGRAIARGAAQAGAKVAVTARSKSELTETVELIQQAGGHALALPADVTDHHAVVGMMVQAVAFMLAVASGQADALSGCYLSVEDDLEALVAEAEAIRRDARLMLRLRI